MGSYWPPDIMSVLALLNELSSADTSCRLHAEGSRPCLHARWKSALQSLLQNVDGITENDNQLKVVSSTGLSSIRPK